MEDAVEGLESPGVKFGLVSSRLKGAVIVFSHEDASRTAVVLWVGDDGGVRDFSAFGVGVILFQVVEP